MEKAKKSMPRVSSPKVFGVEVEKQRNRRRALIPRMPIIDYRCWIGIAS
jgi:hypothetical protein